MTSLLGVVVLGKCAIKFTFDHKELYFSDVTTFRADLNNAFVTKSSLCLSDQAGPTEAKGLFCYNKVSLPEKSEKKSICTLNNAPKNNYYHHVRF